LSAQSHLAELLDQDGGIYFFKDEQIRPIRLSKNFEKINDVIGLVGLLKTRDVSTNDSRRITYSKWVENFDMDIILQGKDIAVDGENMTMDQLIEHVIQNFKGSIFHTLKQASEEGGLEEILDILGYKDKEIQPLIDKLIN